MRTNTVQGQESLHAILDQVEQRARDATTGQYRAVKQLSDNDVPALVKALRRAISGLEDSHEIIATEVACHADEHPDDGCPACVGLCAITAILTSRESPE